MALGSTTVFHPWWVLVEGTKSLVMLPADRGFMNRRWMAKHFLFCSAKRSWRISFLLVASLALDAASVSSWR